jgi:antitoxin PrlF
MNKTFQRIADEAEPDNYLMMRLFLDFAIEEALKNKDLTPYTSEMSTVARDLNRSIDITQHSKLA